MTILRAQVGLLRDTLVPADICMNTWHFLSVGLASPSDTASSAAGQLVAFYEAIDTHLAQYVNSAATIDIYDLQDDEPRVPILSTGFTVTTGSGNAFPAEVAICLSYRGPLSSGTNPARRRGRIFLGPIDSDAGVTMDSDTLVTTTARTNIVDAAIAMMDTGTEEDARWVVFSPTSAGSPPWSEGTLEASSVDVSNVYVDNAFDTVRSRGSLTTARTVGAVTPP